MIQIIHMAHITLSIPDQLYKIMKKYKEVNWSEVARRAIVETLLQLKASDEGLTLEELSMLLELREMKEEVREYSFEREPELLRKIKAREKRRRKLLEELEKP